MGFSKLRGCRQTFPLSPHHLLSVVDFLFCSNLHTATMQESSSYGNACYAGYTWTQMSPPSWMECYRRFHGRGRHFGSGANAAKFTVNVCEKS